METVIFDSQTYRRVRRPPVLGDNVVMLNSSKYSESDTNPRNTLGVIIHIGYPTSEIGVEWRDEECNDGYELDTDIAIIEKFDQAISSKRYLSLF